MLGNPNAQGNFKLVHAFIQEKKERAIKGFSNVELWFVFVRWK